MTTVLIGDGRTVDLTGDATGTIGELADAIARDCYDTGGDGRFSFKIDGVVMHPETAVNQVALRADNTVELVDVTDATWPGDNPPADTHELVETGSLVDADDTEN